MKFKYNISCRHRAMIVHAMEFPLTVKNNPMWSDPFAECFDFSLKNNNRHTIGVCMRIVAGSRCECRKMAAEFFQVFRRSLKQEMWPKTLFSKK